MEIDDEIDLRDRHDVTELRCALVPLMLARHVFTEEALLLVLQAVGISNTGGERHESYDGMVTGDLSTYPTIHMEMSVEHSVECIEDCTYCIRSIKLTAVQTAPTKKGVVVLNPFATPPEGTTRTSLSAMVSECRDKVTTQELAVLADTILSTPLNRRGPKRAHKTSVVNGKAQLAELMRLLDMFGYERSDGQKKMHRSMVGCMLPRIFNNDSEAAMRMAMSEFSLASSSQQVMVVTPRRFGKTMALSMYVAALALAVSGVTIVIYSTCKRASSAVLTNITSMIRQIPGGSDRITTSNQEKVHVSGGGTESMISSYPGQPRT